MNDKGSKIIERNGNYCKTKGGNVYRIKVGSFGEDYGFIANIKIPLSEYLEGIQSKINV